MEMNVGRRLPTGHSIGNNIGHGVACESRVFADGGSNEICMPIEPKENE